MQAPGIVRVGGLEIDTRCMPVVLVRYHDGQSGADFARMTDLLVGWAEERRWIGMLHDTTRLTTVVGAADRKVMREVTERATPVMNRKAIGSAVIIRSAVVRGAMTAAKWFMSHEFPEKIFATAGDGAEWLVTRFQEEGQPLPPAIVAQLRGISAAHQAA